MRERLKLTAAAGFAGLSLWPGDAMALLGEGHSAADIAALIADHGLVLTEFESICSWFPQQATGARGQRSPHRIRTNQVSALVRMKPIGVTADTPY